MKKIKLIKLYPGSPKNLGITLTPKVDVNNNDANNFYWEGSWFNPNHYPEYWEEVVELNYEIVAMKTLMGVVLEYEDGVCVKRSDTICPSTTTKLQDCLRGISTIYSIKRLSDGEIFTIGDSVEGGTILEIHIDKFYTGGVAFSLDTSRVESLISIEKAVEKDYEILSYIKKGSTTCTTTKRRGGELHDEYWNIHSVKRLSDGEIFTLGDVIKRGEQGSNKVIEKFGIVNDNSSIKNGIYIEYLYGGFHLSGVIKIKKQPIFLTHDGKDIFVGDKVWYVNKENLYHDYAIALARTSFTSNTHAYFLTREAAEDYIKRNKACLSYNDIVETMCLNGCGIGLLQELVNKKLGIE